MQNYRLTIQYDGTRYNGWQMQGNTDNTIQAKVQNVLSRLDGSDVEVHASGRTDAGVHAFGQVASVRLNHAVKCEELLHYCAEFLPQDIAVIAAECVPERFHARLNAKRKCYVYRIWNDETPNVFERSYLCRFSESLDVDVMRQAAALLVGTHDYRSFCGLKKYKKSTVRTVDSIEISTIGKEIRFTYVGNGFLNRMVRILTGTLVEVGLGERSADSMPGVLAAQDRSAAGRTMPPEGLCLHHVTY